jgi:hypothetical protein
MSLSIYDNAYFPAAYFPHKYWSVGYWPILVQAAQETKILSHPPCRILKEYIEDAVLVDWVVYAGDMPEVESDVLSVFDTTPVVHNRVHTGMYSQHYGLQVGARVSDYAAGNTKMQELYESLQTAQNAIVEIGDETYRIKSVSFSSGVISLGIEPETKRGNLFTMNMLCVIVGVVE